MTGDFFPNRGPDDGALAERRVFTDPRENKGRGLKTHVGQSGHDRDRAQADEQGIFCPQFLQHSDATGETQGQQSQSPTRARLGHDDEPDRHDHVQHAKGSLIKACGAPMNAGDENECGGPGTVLLMTEDAAPALGA